MKSKTYWPQLGFVVFLAVGAVALVYSAAETLLVIGASLLAAFPVVLLAGRLSRKTERSKRQCAALILFLVALSFGLFFTLLGQQLTEQAGEFQKKLPELVQTAEKTLTEYPLVDRIWTHVQPQDFSSFGSFDVIFSGTMGLISSLLLFLVLTLYFVFQSDLYRSGAKKLLGRFCGSNRATGFLNRLSNHMWGFLVGQLRAMVVVAIMTTVGLWALGIPLYIGLGLTAGLMAFVPMLGPLFSTVPAVLVALPEGMDKVVWVLVLFAGIQLLESNLITPMIQQDASQLPPAMALAFQAVMGTLAGPVGVFMAAPTAVVALVLGQEWVGDSASEAESESD